MFWTNQPQAPWQTDEWLDEMRRSLRPHQYLRMIENRFVASEETFIDMAWWDACTTGRPVMADASMPVWAAVDASVKHDSTALLACTWDKETKRVRQVWHRIFQPSPDQPLDFENTVEQSLLELKHRFAVRAVLYDPYQMASVAQRLAKRGLRMEEFPQTVPNLTAASQNLYELIKSQGLSVYPDDDIRLAVQRAVALETTRGWRIAKGESLAQDRRRGRLGHGRLRGGAEGREWFHAHGHLLPDSAVRRRSHPLERRVAAAAARGPRLREGSACDEIKGTMVRPAIGDICEIRQLPGERWVVIGPVTNPADPGKRQWRVRAERAGRPPQGRVVGAGDLEVLEHPQFTAGQIVNFHGNEAEVLSDDGDTVRLRYLHLRPRNLDRLIGRAWRQPTVRVGEIDVDRGDLVAQQL